MKNNLLKFLKVFLLVALVVLMGLLVIGIVLVVRWPWWVVIFLILFIAGVTLGIFLILRLIKRNREKKFVSDIVAQDEAQARVLPAAQRNERKQLQANLKTAIDVLHKSHLKKMGNPLYVLPWYMIIGESGSGKTTSLNSARLASPFPELGKTVGLSGTHNCEWWFLDQAIIIDTAGRYAVPVNGNPDTQEWQSFLSLLAKYRKKEPLNGLIVTIAADKLLGAAAEALEEEARTIRRRIDELMRVLGVKFPVYVLVTKCDLIQGINRFCEKLSDESLRQPMGMINQNLSTDTSSFVEGALQAIGKRLRNLRMLLLHFTENKNMDPPLMLFPEEFDDIRKSLTTFTKTLFGQNPYQETPVFRGMFFSSGRQEGNPRSHFSQTLGIRAGDENLPGTVRGLFLHDFFAKILPGDRRLLTPTRKAMEWAAVTNNLGLTAWVVVWIALCGLLSFSFVKNLHTISGISREFQKVPVLRGELLPDMVSMDHFRKSVLRVEEQNRSWWIPRFGLRESMQVEKGLKEQYCKQFGENFMQPFDRKLLETIRSLPPSVTDDEYSQYMSHLVRRINILNVALEHPDLEILRKKPQPVNILANQNAQILSPEAKNSFGNLYLHYLIWKPDSKEIQKELDILQGILQKLYTLRGPNMMWLVALAGKDSPLAPVTLNDFWGDSMQMPGEKQIHPCFTSAGRQSMDAFVKELEEAYPKAPQLGRNKMEFDARYRALCLEAWMNFAEGFAAGSVRLKDVSDWRRAAARMAVDGGPYFAFINRVTLELAPLFVEEQPPAWFAELARFQGLRTQAAAQDTGTGGKVAEGGKKMLASVEKMTGRDTGSKNMEMQLAAVSGYNIYRSSLAAIAPNGKDTAYWVCKNPDNMVVRNSTIFSGYNKGRWCMVVRNGKEGRYYHRIKNILFSPDGAKLAYIIQNESQGDSFAVVLNDKKERNYANIRELTFSPDSSTLVYIAADDKGDHFIVVSGREGKRYKGLSDIVYSPDSRHYAFRAKEDFRWFIVRDSLEGESFHWVGPPAFSADSVLLTYGAQGGITLRKDTQGNILAYPSKTIDGVQYIEFQVNGQGLTYAGHSNSEQLWTSTDGWIYASKNPDDIYWVTESLKSSTKDESGKGERPSTQLRVAYVNKSMESKPLLLNMSYKNPDVISGKFDKVLIPALFTFEKTNISGKHKSTAQSGNESFSMVTQKFDLKERSTERER